MEPSRYPRVVTVAALLVALAAGVYIALHLYGPVIEPVLEVVPPFAIALVFAFLLDPVVDWLQRRGLSRGIGVVIVGLGFIVVFVVAGFLIVPKVADQAATLAQNLPSYSQRLFEIANDLLARHKPLLERLRLPTTLGEWTTRFSSQIEGAVSSSLSFLAGALTSMLSRILWVIIIPLATLWILKDLDYIKAKVVHFTPESHKERLMHMSSAVGGVLGKYIRGMLAVAIIYSVVASTWLTLAGLEYALILGGISGLFYLIPYVGTLMIVVAAGVVAIVQPWSLGAVVAVMAALGVQSFVLFDLVVTPKVVGGSVGVHPVLMLFSLALGARLFGVVGMVAAVPVAAAIQVALGQYYPRIYDQLKPNRSRHP